MNKLSKIKCIGFDMDGTLYPKTKEIRDLKKQLCCDYLVRKGNVSPEKAEEWFNKEIARTGSYTYVLKHHGIEDAKEVLESKTVNNKLVDLIKFDPQIKKLLEQIKAKYKTFLITHTYKKYAVPRMSKAGIDYKKNFDVCIFGDSGLLKTSEEVFNVVLDKLKLRPEEVLHVGDREVVDIIVPKQMGMSTAIVDGRSTLADYHLKSVYDLQKLLTL